MVCTNGSPRVEGRRGLVDDALSHSHAILRLPLLAFAAKIRRVARDVVRGARHDVVRRRDDPHLLPAKLSHIVEIFFEIFQIN